MGALLNGPGVHQPRSAVFQLRTPVSDTLLALTGRAPYSEPAADKPSETKAFPQPPSAPLTSIGSGPGQLVVTGRRTFP